MKRTIQQVFFLLGCFLLLTSHATWAAEEKPIILSGEEAMAGIAKVEGKEVYLPASLLHDAVYQNTEIRLSEKQFLVYAPLPRFALPESSMNILLREKSSVFALPLKLIDGVAYVEMDSASKLLGFSWKNTGESLLLRPNAYGSFAPRILPKLKVQGIPPGEKLSVVWQPFLAKEIDLSHLEKHPGLDIVSPSWMEIADPDGRLYNKIDAGYVRRAKEKGYGVWALITNQFDPALTSKVLRNEKARKNVVKQLAVYTSIYSLDGINLDFENIYDTDRDHLSAFVSEITEALHKLGAAVSIDVTAPSNISQWSLCYDRTALGAAVDYVVIMAYDEHWRTSPVSGSVASIGWVEQGVRNTLQEIPADKIILGVPFYMREWEEVAGRKTSVRTMTMDEAKATIAARGLEPIWLEEEGQYYFSYEENGKLYRVWQEEERSLELKLRLVDRYNLAGVAAWRKGFESQDIWNLLQHQLKTSAKEEKTQKDEKKDLKKKSKKMRLEN